LGNVAFRAILFAGAIRPFKNGAWGGSGETIDRKHATTIVDEVIE
jgi:hypothetical protein